QRAARNLTGGRSAQRRRNAPAPGHRRQRAGPGGGAAALNTNSAVTGRYDINRDGRVNALDLALVRRNLNRSLGSMTPPAFPPAARFSSSIAGSVATPLLAPEAGRTWDDARRLL